MANRTRQTDGTVPAAPVRVYTLGRFAIETEGDALGAGKGGGKPLALLKALIALGGEGVHANQLAESLWPDSDGDLAYGAFTTTLRRLRGIIGADALRLEGGRLSLDPRRCWVDAHAFTEALARAEQARHAGTLDVAREHLDAALALYRGPFLAGEFEPPEVLSARERSHGLFLRHVGDLADALAAAGEAEPALALCRRALELDDVAEELYRRVMALCRDLGRTSEGLAAYARCRELLRATAGVEPAPETEALAAALRNAPPAPLSAQPASPPPRGPRSSSAADATALRMPVLAVLPFATLGEDAEQAAFSQGLSEDLAAALAGLGGLRVVRLEAPASSAAPDPAARASGATHLLEGTVRLAGSRVRITVALTEAASRHQLWADRYDREFADLFAMQDDITDRIVTELDVQLVEGEQARLRRRGTQNVEAWRLVKQANRNFFLLRMRGSIESAIDGYERAIVADSSYAYPVRMIIMVRCYELEHGMRPLTPENLAEVERLAARARELDPAAAGNLGVTARIHLVRREYDQVLEFARQAIEAEPTHADLVGACSWYLALAGQPEEAIQAVRLASRYGAGHRLFLRMFHCAIEYVREQYESAVTAFHSTDPGGSPGEGFIYTVHPYFAVGAAVALGRHDEALAIHARCGELGVSVAWLRQALDALPMRDQSVIERLRGHLREVGIL